MKLCKPVVIAATATALLVGLALPASAATSPPVDTATTFTLTGGDLNLTVQGSAALTNAASGTTAITGTLGVVNVADERGVDTPWAASTESTTFTGAIPVLSGGSVSTGVAYTGGTVTETGTITVADGTLTSLTAGVAPVVSPSALSGNNTASWNPTLAVTMPSNALADSYSGTVTTSIL